MSLERRINRLEQRSPDPVSHTTPVLIVPHDVEWHTYLHTQRCPCGFIGCAEHRILVALPQKETQP